MKAPITPCARRQASGLIPGDVAIPRRGTLWMGTLIKCGASHGLSESLVRTAVSRLVGAGSLVGDRVGRKGCYRLSERAQSEFAVAARGRAGR